MEASAGSVERVLARTHAILRGLAQRDGVRALDAARCDPALPTILSLDEGYANLLTVASSGHRVCSAVPPGPGTPARFDLSIFADAGPPARGFMLARPAVGRATGRWTAYAALPILQEGQVAGMVVAGIDLAHLSRVLDPRTLPMSSVVTLVDGRGTVLVRHPGQDHWAGKDGSSLPAVRAARAGLEGVVRARGLDGIDRFWAYKPVRGSPWLAFAGVSSEAVLDEPRRQARYIVLAAAAITLAALGLSHRIARRISDPMERMAAAARALGHEDAPPLLPAGPAEVVALAEALNATRSERLATERRLRDERARMEGLVASAMDGVIAVDARNRVVLFNAAAERMFRVPAAEAIGSPLARFMPERFRAGHDAHVERFAREGRTSRQMGALGTVWGLRAGGEEFPIEASISQVHVGAERYLTAIVRDVGDRLRAEREVRTLAAALEQRVAERTAELEAANAELKAFDYSISHDLRGPLGRIAGFAMALREDHGHRLGAEALGFVERIAATARRMEELVDDLLELSTVSRREIDRQDVDLGAIARSVADALRRSGEDRHVEFSVDPDLRAHADPGLVRIVLENLLGNAWKFTSRRAQARIEVGATQAPGGGTVFHVRDNGAGFDPAAAQRLFEPFRRLHAQAEFEGTGIGLATVRRIVRRHGGEVWADGAVGAGATFYFTLEPRARP